MKKFFTSVAAILFAACINNTSAQTYTINPNDTLVVSAPYNTLSIYDIFQDNITSSPIDLAWTLVSNNLVAGWDYSLCDLGHCYTGLPSSGQMDPVPVSGQGFLGLNVDPGSISGTGFVRIYVYDLTAPGDGDTLTWIVSTTVGIDEQNSLLQVNLFPNPATDYITVQSSVSGVETIEITITDVTGRTVGASVSNIGSQYLVNIAELPAGNYILRCSTSEGYQAQRQFIKAE